MNRRQFVGAAAALSAFPAIRGAAAETADVLILGAGLAGLYAALLLEEQGYRPLVLEARARVGGRLLTLDELPGKPETGGQTLGGMYARTFSLLDRLGLGKRQRRYTYRDLTIAHRGALTTDEEWPDSPLNPLTGPLRSTRPDRLYRRALQTINPLAGMTTWLDDDNAALDRHSIGSELALRGVSDEALALMEVAFDGKALHQMSSLFAFRKARVAEFNREAGFRVAGGSSRLPEAMTAALRTEVRLNKVVRRIEAGADGAAVTCADGSRYRAQRLLCSIPFPALRRVAIDPAPAGALAAAIATLPYTPITHVHMTFDRPFWEDDGLPVQTWSSDPMLERVFAFDDHEGELQTLNCWFNGFGALRIDRMTTAQIKRELPRALARLRPASAGHLRVAAVKSWARDPFAGGAYHFYSPGQVDAVAESLTAAYGPLHFIGEHTARFQQGMEGALESAEERVFSLLDI